MITFNLPDNFDGIQLRDELNANGVVISYDNASVEVAGGKLLLAIEEKDKTKAQTILNAHSPKPIPEPTIAEKLESVGLNLDDLKAALGL